MQGHKCQNLTFDILVYFPPYPFQLLCLIGEAFDESSDEVCGAVVNIRAKGDKLAIWTGDARKADATKAIGLVLVCTVASAYVISTH